MIRNENIVSAEIGVPGGTTSSAPYVQDIRLFDPALLEAWIWIASGSPAYVRLTDKRHGIIPADASWLPLPATSVLDIDLEKIIEGPPWVITVEAFQPTSGAAVINIILRTGQIEERDTEYLILQALTAMNTKEKKP